MAKRGMRAFGLLIEAGVGLAATGAVFLGLTALTGAAGGPPPETRERLPIHFTRQVVVTPDERPRRSKPKPPEPAELTGAPGLGTPERAGRPAPATRVAFVASPAPSRFAHPRGMEAAGVDTDSTPVLRVLPEYPPSGRGAGSVLVRFDVTALGTVANARVIESTPRGMFDAAALRAIARWRYRPAVVDGRAVERRGFQVRLRFEVERA